MLAVVFSDLLGDSFDERTEVQKVPVAALRFTPAGMDGANQSSIWIIGADRQPQAVPVKVGLSDGKFVEVTSVEPMERVIIGVDRRALPPSLTRRIIGSM